MVDGRGGRRRLRHSDLTDPFRTLARRLGVRGGEVRSAEATRRYHAATSGAQRALADQLDQRPYLDDPDTLVMGVESYFAPDVHKYRGDTNKVVIGNWCSIAADADFYVGGMHPIEWVTTFGIREMFMLEGGFRPPMPRSHGDIVVGHDCWITEGSTVLSGVTIGNGAVVATKAVVTKDVRPYAIVAGNPAQEIGRRFDDGQIAALERIRWWDWDVPTVIDRVADLNGATVDDFIATYDPGRSGVE